MSNKKTTLAASLLALVLAGFGLPVPAAASPAEIQFRLSFSPALPRGEFHDLMGWTVWGGALNFAIRPSRGPLLFGTRLGFGAYDTDRWDAWLGLTIPDVLVDVRTTNSVLTWDVFLRLQPERGFLRPYLELFAGLHFLSTDTRIGDGNWDDNNSGDMNVNNASDTAFAYGAGAGVMFPLIGFMHRDGRRVGSLELDLGVRFARGGRADYLVETGLTGIYDTLRSRTDLLTLSAGLMLSF
jgi:hypothetical protein